MGQEQVHCENCGALMSPGTDGRTYVCSYCRAEQLVAIDASQLAAGMQLDMANADAFLSQLANALSNSLRDRTRVHLDGERVVGLELSFDKDLYVATRGPDGILAQHKRVVRGVALKTVTHPLDRWVGLLTDSIAAHANASAQTAHVIALLSGARRS